jgi:hypothetical protein
MVLKVGAVSVPVVFTDCGGDLGEYQSAPSCQIRVAPGLGEPHATMTLVHEVIHAIVDQYGVELGESQVRCLETALCRFVQDNPGFCSEIVRRLGDPG